MDTPRNIAQQLTEMLEQKGEPVDIGYEQTHG